MSVGRITCQRIQRPGVLVPPPGAATTLELQSAGDTRMNSNVTPPLMRHQDMAGEVRREDTVDSEYSSLGRQEIQAVYPPHWLTVGHNLRKMRAKVSIFSCDK